MIDKNNIFIIRYLAKPHNTGHYVILVPRKVILPKLVLWFLLKQLKLCFNDMFKYSDKQKDYIYYYDININGKPVIKI